MGAYPVVLVNALDFAVLAATLLGIVGYGLWRTRRDAGLISYLKGDADTRALAIGVSVMATQASAITFLSLPGQAYESGMGFVQNYFGLPFALIVVCAVFIPAFQRWGVFTAYEYLGRRFDEKTRRLGAALFLVQRGLATGITLYAPAIILSALLGWNLSATILLSGGLVILYTTTGGARAVSVTQQLQLGVAFVGMVAAFGVVVASLPADVSLGQAFTVAGKLGKLDAVDFSIDPSRRYTFWSGLLGGFFLALSYFGADQTQVQRYLAGESSTRSRLGLLFNALLKIPMQAGICLVGALVFVFYQFERPPLSFAPGVATSPALEQAHSAAFAARHDSVRRMLGAPDALAAAAAQREALSADARLNELRVQARREAAQAGGARPPGKDSDFVFLTFVLNHLPRGLVGLVVAVVFCAAMSAAAAGLGGLASTTMVDFYRPLFRPDADEAHGVRASRWLTAGWGVVAVGFALFANLVENLIEAGNILGSLFYGSVLGLFLVAFLLPRVRGSAVFWAGVCAQVLVLALYATLSISYLWFNVIGCATVMLLSSAFQATIFRAAPAENSRRLKRTV